MCPHCTAYGLEIGQRHSLVPKPRRFPNELLRMAGTTEKRVVALYDKFTPPMPCRAPRPRRPLFVSNPPHTRIACRMGMQLWFRLFGHVFLAIQTDSLRSFPRQTTTKGAC